MRVNEFLYATAKAAQQQLPARLRSFRTRTRFTLIQIYYDKRSIHYEVWVRGNPHHLIEVGLHLESDRATNARLLDYFQMREVEIRGELGLKVEVEQWTQSWARVHQVVPYEKLDDALVATVAPKLAEMIAVLQPMLSEFGRGE